MPTINVIDQLKKSQDMQAAILPTDTVAMSQTDTDTLVRVIALMNGVQLARIMGQINDDQIARVIGLMTDDQLVRAMGRMNDNTRARVMGLMNGIQLARVMDMINDDTLVCVIRRMGADKLGCVIGLMNSENSQRIIGLLNAEIPVVIDLDKKMLEAVESGRFDMSTWHRGNTHCRAGWAVVFGGKEGEELEKIFGTEFAGKLIYEASTGRIAPDFYSSTTDAIADIRRCASVVS